MKRVLSAAAILAFALSTPAWGATIDAIRANTVTTKAADGALTSWRFNADGTFQMKTPDGKSSGGTYTSDDAHFCFTPQGGQQACVAPAPANKGPGDSWQTKDAQGKDITVAIVPGR